VEIVHVSFALNAVIENNLKTKWVYLHI